jgi:hypothetical protein
MLKLKLFLPIVFLVIFSGCDDDHIHEHSHDGTDHSHEVLEIAGEKEQNQTKEEDTLVVVLDKNESKVEDVNKSNENNIIEVEDVNKSDETYSIFKIKQTTQIESYDEFGNIDTNLQDDGFYKKGETPNYTRDANKSIVTDMLTGLMWQDDEDVKTEKRVWESIDVLEENATSYCLKLELASYDDWRIPSRYELADIVNYGSSDTVFQNIASGFFWSSSTYEINNLNNWAVDFEIGFIKQKLNTTPLHLRCVRGKKLEEKSTKLKWHDGKDINALKTWHEAILYCEELEVDSGAWRLANINELKSIIDDSSFNPASKEDMLAGKYWSGTSYLNNHTVVWIVDFYTAEISLNDKNGKKLVRCVK